MLSNSFDYDSARLINRVLTMYYVEERNQSEIAKLLGLSTAKVNRLLKQFDQMQKMMKKLSKKGAMKNMMRGMRGQLPPGFPMQ